MEYVRLRVQTLEAKEEEGGSCVLGTSQAQSGLVAPWAIGVFDLRPPQIRRFGDSKRTSTLPCIKSLNPKRYESHSFTLGRGSCSGIGGSSRVTHIQVKVHHHPVKVDHRCRSLGRSWFRGSIWGLGIQSSTTHMEPWKGWHRQGRLRNILSSSWWFQSRLMDYQRTISWESSWVYYERSSNGRFDAWILGTCKRPWVSPNSRTSYVTTAVEGSCGSQLGEAYRPQIILIIPTKQLAIRVEEGPPEREYSAQLSSSQHLKRKHAGEKGKPKACASTMMSAGVPTIGVIGKKLSWLS